MYFGNVALPGSILEILETHLAGCLMTGSLVYNNPQISGHDFIPKKILTKGPFFFIAQISFPFEIRVQSHFGFPYQGLISKWGYFQGLKKPTWKGSMAIATPISLGLSWKPYPNPPWPWGLSHLLLSLRCTFPTLKPPSLLSPV